MSLREKMVKARAVASNEAEIDLHMAEIEKLKARVYELEKVNGTERQNDKRPYCGFCEDEYDVPF